MVDLKKRKFEEEGLAPQQNVKIIKWRNYHPQDKKLIVNSNENQEPNGKSNEITHESTPTTSHDNPIKKELRKYQKEELNLLPRNNNWDVKKSLEPKIEKLKRRTQKAIVDFLREKLANMSDSDDNSDLEES